MAISVSSKIYTSLYLTGTFYFFFLKDWMGGAKTLAGSDSWNSGGLSGERYNFGYLTYQLIHTVYAVKIPEIN